MLKPSAYYWRLLNCIKKQAESCDTHGNGIPLGSFCLQLCHQTLQILAVVLNNVRRRCHRVVIIGCSTGSELDSPLVISMDRGLVGIRLWFRCFRRNPAFVLVLQSNASGASTGRIRPHWPLREEITHGVITLRNTPGHGGICTRNSTLYTYQVVRDGAKAQAVL